jgi:fused signal recognition particle receptor
MFRSLKEKLNKFKKKATKELQTRGEMEKPAAKPDAGSAAKMGSKLEVKKLAEVKKPKPRIERKRSRGARGAKGGLSKSASLKRQIEKETEDQSPWEDIGQKEILGDEDSGWFAKTISDDKLSSIMWDLEVALLESDVALPVVDEVKSYLNKELTGKKVKRSSDLESLIEAALRNSIYNVLTTKIIHFDNFIEKQKKPVKLMFVGVNGTGKTSAIAKIAFRLKKKKISCVMAAGDTFRAGAIEQLERHAKKLGVKLIKDKAGSDPAAIAYDAIEHAKARHKDVVLIDTAGRMQTNINLMDEMRKVKRVTQPDLIIFVGDALAGNDVVEQAKEFEKVVGIDAAVLTKLDADAKGGAALSIAHAVGKPIIFVSVGQRYGDLVPFNPEWMVNRIFE